MVVNEYLPRKGRFALLRNVPKALRKNISYRVWIRKLKKYKATNIRLKLVEIGSGAGYLLQAIAKHYPNSFILGGDRDEGLLSHSQGQSAGAYSLVQLDAMAIPLRANSIDVIFSLQVVEHLDKPEEFLTECARVLKAEGILMLSTPNPIGISAKILKGRWQGIKPDHVSLRSPQEWRASLYKAGFDILEEGTTGLTGFRLLRYPPLCLVNYIPMAVLGFFPWYKGESYMVIAKKRSLWKRPSLLE